MIFKRAFWFLLAASLAITVPPQIAEAQQPKMTKKERREAKKLFNKAHLAYRRGDYEEAIVKWEQSYELSKEALIFLSIANAYERLGDTARAIEYLKRWRAEAPRREHKELDGRIVNLEDKLREEQELESAAAKENEAELAAEKERLRSEMEAKQQRDRDQATDSDNTMWQIIGWTGVGVGAAGIIAGVIMDGVAAGMRPAEEEACTDSGGQLLCRDAQRSDIESSNTLAIAGDITWIAGTAIAGGGVVVLLLLGYADNPDDKSDARIVPHVGPEGGGISVTARF